MLLGIELNRRRRHTPPAPGSTVRPGDHRRHIVSGIKQASQHRDGVRWCSHKYKTHSCGPGIIVSAAGGNNATRVAKDTR